MTITLWNYVIVCNKCVMFGMFSFAVPFPVWGSNFKLEHKVPFHTRRLIDNNS